MFEFKLNLNIELNFELNLNLNSIASELILNSKSIEIG